MWRPLLISSCILAVTPVMAFADDAPDASNELSERAVATLTVAIARCDRGDAAKCFEAAADVERYQLDLVPEQMPPALRKRGWSLLDRNCERGDAEVCHRYAQRLIDERELDAALDKLDRACTLDHAEACLALGIRYRTGAGVKQNVRRAVQFFDHACDAGSARACMRLADELQASAGARERVRIQKLHRKACKGDDAIGCVRTAETRRANGDRLGAHGDFFRACELGHVTSCHEAGTLTDAPDRARILFLRACDGGMAKSCNKLSDLLLSDDGGERNWGKAIEFAEKGCALEKASPCKRAAKIRQNPPDWRCKTERDCERLCRQGIGKSCRRYAQFLDEETLAFELGCEAGDRESCKRSRRREER